MKTGTLFLYLHYSLSVAKSVIYFYKIITDEILKYDNKSDMVC